MPSGIKKERPGRRLWSFFFCGVLACGLLAGPARAIKWPEGVGLSGIPFFGYDDKNGWTLGAAGFLYRDADPGFKLGLYGASNLKDFNSTTITYEGRQAGWGSYFTAVAERSFDNYYGEGNHTASENPFLLRMNHVAFNFSLLHAFFAPLPSLRLGPYLDHRLAQELSLERSQPKPGDPERIFPDERSLSLGLRAVWDSRDSLLNPASGSYASLIVRDLPPALGSQEAFMAQADLDLRHFENTWFNTVWASRLLAGFSLGEPSYLYRYRLGGTDTLRGYKDNRFRGKNYYLLQQELRYALWPPFVFINVSADAGSFMDGGLEVPKASGQIGLRLGLPPDWGQRVRFDFGISQDQTTLQIQFGEVF